MESMGIANILERESVLGVQDMPILIGCGTDGQQLTSPARMACVVNCKQYCNGCFGPGVTLTVSAVKCSVSINNSLSCLLKEIDEMLLRLYYLYEKSPRAC